MIGIIKCADKRNDYISDFLPKKEIILSKNLEDFLDVNIVIAPLNGFDSDLCFKGTSISLEDFYKQNPGLKRIIVGLVNSKLINFCHKNEIEIISILANEEIMRENAFLTSEALIREISKDEVSLRDKRIAIMGYGNITHYLIEILNGYQNKPAIYTPNILEQKFVGLRGLEVIKNIELINQYDLIINTIPENLYLHDRYSELVKPIIDVASYPYGFDPIIAKKENINITYLGGLPGKVLPFSSAMVILPEIKKSIYFSII